jgi:hypothetical protein
MAVYTAESGNGPAAGRPRPFPQGQSAQASQRATIRTYRHGSGDSHLVTLVGECGATCRILIDGGVPPATTDAGASENQIVDDILEHTDGHVDLLVDFTGASHSAEALAQLDVGEVWLAWTDDPADPEARALHAERGRALDKLRLAAAEVQLRGSEAESRAIDALLAYYGVTGRATTGDPLAALRARTPAPTYCRPGNAPRELPAVGARIYLFGRPPGTEGHAASRDSSGAALALDDFVHNVMPSLEGTAVDNPFSTLYSIPEPVARAMPFFEEHYWEDAPWRRIDTAWITDATQYALVLDSLTHGTGLGLAIELDGGDVLLFAPEGAHGTGLLPGQQTWSSGGRQVDGHDLLSRTVFYKAGHHGGLNASTGPDGLALMPKLRGAVIPVDRNGGVPTGEDIPTDALQNALADAIGARGYVLRTDQEPPPLALDKGVTATARYFDVQL